MNDLRPDTLAVRGGLARSNFDETSEGLFLTSGYVYSSAQEAEAAFRDEIDRFVHSRYGNPTVHMFQERMRLLEGTEACFATASGMAAVFVALGALLRWVRCWAGAFDGRGARRAGRSTGRGARRAGRFWARRSSSTVRSRT
ncbi:MAG: PLP-dependent transferase [Dermatophilaceae bacterium]